MARPGTRKIQRYTAEFKIKAVKLTQIDNIQVKDVAEALDIHPFMLSRWRKEVADGVIQAPPEAGPDHDQIEDIKQFTKLKREHALLKQEHELLKKAIRFCSEQRSGSTRSSERNRTGSA